MKPGREMAVNGAPGMQGDLETSVAMMAKIGACWSPSFSPDGQEIALISDISGVPQVWRTTAKGGWPEQVTSLPDQIFSVSWSPDGEWLAFNLAPGGGMNQQVYLVRPDGREMRQLTKGGKENNWLGSWACDGRKLVIASSQRSAAAMDAYLYDLESDQLTLVSENQGIGYFADVSRDGGYAILYRMVNRSDNNLYLVRLEDGAETCLTPHEGPGSFSGGRFSPDGNTIYLSSNKDRDRLVFGKIEIDSGGVPGGIEVLVAREDVELEGFDLTKDGETAALLWNSAGYNEIEFVDLTTSTVSPGPKLPAEIAGVPRFSQDGNKFAVVLSGSDAPMNVYVYDRRPDRMWRVTNSQHAGVDLESLTRPELVRFPAHDGLELSGWLYVPADYKAPGPIVLNFHGGPEGQEQPNFRSTYQALLARGIAVFAPNVRGSSGFGKRFVNLDNGPLRFDAIRDIETCVDFVIAKGVADASRVGIAGGSYGGYMTMAGLTAYPDRFAAGANYFGIVNFETFFEHTEPWMAEISKIQYGDPVTQKDLLRALSPIHKLDQVQAATIVLHGANDTNVPVIEAEQVVKELEARDIPVKYVLFPDEGHGFRKEPNRIRATVEMVQWFTEYLKA